MRRLLGGNERAHAPNMRRVWRREAKKHVFHGTTGQERAGRVEVQALRRRAGSTPRPDSYAEPRGSAPATPESDAETVYGMRPPGKRRGFLAEAMGQKNRG